MRASVVAASAGARLRTSHASHGCPAVACAGGHQPLPDPDSTSSHPLAVSRPPSERDALPRLLLEKVFDNDRLADLDLMELVPASLGVRAGCEEGALDVVGAVPVLGCPGLRLGDVLHVETAVSPDVPQR